MYVTFLVLSLLLAAVLLFVGGTKLTRQQRMTDAAEHLGYSGRAFRLIGALEVAAAAVVIGVVAA